MQLPANIKKELLLLSRDRAGLLVLFVMPMLLVLVLSLIQDNLFRATGETATRALFVNLDKGVLGKEFAAKLEATGTIELIEEAAGEQIKAETARQLVLKGDFQFAIIIPAEFSTGIDRAAEEAVKSAFHGENPSEKTSHLTLYFDPTVRGVYRSAVMSGIQQGVLGLEISRKVEAFGRLLPQELQRSIKEQLMEYGIPDLQLEMIQLRSEWTNLPLIELTQESAYPEKYSTLPSSVQQNVPAWTLFGMFFIVIPLAGTLIRERQEGTLTRLMTMPVGTASLLFGKVFAYLCVCLMQCCLMLVVGKFILPLLGTPALELGSSPTALVVVAVSGALAACGFGILVGVLASSYEQASTFGAVSVVIAAALGGVMVPVYVMPRIMQDLSVISPLAWGLDAFLEIFVRNGNLLNIMPQVAALTAFFLVCILFALIVFHRLRQGSI